MDFLSNLSIDPAELALVMAALALVVAMMTALHYALDRRAMLDRINRFEAMTLKPSPSPARQEETREDFFELPDSGRASGDEKEEAAIAAPEVIEDVLPPGTRFV